MKLGALYADGRCVLPRVWKTTTAWDRLRGLLGRPPLAAGEGLLIEPCASVHTFGMGYALDLAFIDASWRVSKLVTGLRPARLAAGLGAARTLELAAGGLAQAGLRAGETLTWRET